MRWNHQRRLFSLACLAALPALASLTLLAVTMNVRPAVFWVLLLFSLGGALFAAYAIYDRVTRALQSLSNLVEALQAGDYSIRAHDDGGEGALAEVAHEVNKMAATLREQRLGAMEASALLRRVMTEIDVAVFAFDPAQRLVLANRAAERLLDQPAERLLGRAAVELNLDSFLQGPEQQTVPAPLGRMGARWGVRRSPFREGGQQHQLLVISDLTKALREEEVQAWQRIVRVLGHELNNSLTPIRSIAESLVTLQNRTPRPDDWEDDLRQGMTIIATRSNSLSRFLGAYAQVARLPQPTMKPVLVSGLVQRVAVLEQRLRVMILPGPDVTIDADADQLEQALINLVRNATDATLDVKSTPAGMVSIGWTTEGRDLQIQIRDEGPGLSNTNNLFVPFFTTKPGGSGVGLVLSRHIAEAHGGGLSLQNRGDRRGCIATLTLALP